jgi:protein-serine/threonine kinase
MQGMEKVNDDFYIDRSKELGKGNYGVVYKGYHLSENRIIAVKFMEKKMLNKIPEHEREIQIMAELAKITHPNIMGYYGYEKNEKGLFFFIEFCSGGTLKQLINKKMSELKVLTLFKQFMDAMTYINSLSTSAPTQTNCIVTSSQITCCSMRTRNSK